MTAAWTTPAMVLAVVLASSSCGADESCATAASEPAPTWSTFGDGFLRSHCQGCHGGSAPDRHGAPVDVRFDVEADVERWREAILATATGEAARMPPGGGVSSEQRARLDLWLRCDR